MKMQQEIQKKLKIELEDLSNQSLSDADAWEAYFNFSNFLKILTKMKKEATNAVL